jgi:hypothetical protein
MMLICLVVVDLNPATIDPMEPDRRHRGAPMCALVFVAISGMVAICTWAHIGAPLRESCMEIIA